MRGKWIAGSVMTLLVGSVGILYWGNQQKDEVAKPLVVMSYASFTASWGPGPELAKRFEAKTGVPVRFVQADDAGVLLQRLKLVPADVVLGLDQSVLNGARSEMRWLPHVAKVDFPHDDLFVPIDWAPVGFVYREGELAPPSSLDDLRLERFKNQIALEDPRTSAPGFQFLSWIARGRTDVELKALIQQMHPSIQSVSPSWSQAYGLFTRGTAKLVLSYMTSPLYHQVIERDGRYRFASFPEGHAVHVEFAGILAKCARCDRAREFLQFLLLTENQKLIMEKNWMLPVVELPATEDVGPFREVMEAARYLKPKDMSTLQLSAAERERLLKLWSEASP
ncbi:MAG: thiamine ABC transporter substrate-binding protein [Bdellovibrionaceae bacterium]|nr:thiamine ABC transporter substrate-binding protein [Pseudobdellovibrionaceae bacterium]